MRIRNKSIEKLRRVPVDLTHTEILNASVNRENIRASSWLDVLNHILTLAGKEVPHSNQLGTEFSSNGIEASKEDSKHVHHLKEINVSIRPANANEAWKVIKQASKQMKLKLNIEFKWLDIPEASRRGYVGIMRVRGPEIAIYQTKSE